MSFSNNHIIYKQFIDYIKDKDFDDFGINTSGVLVKPRFGSDIFLLVIKEIGISYLMKLFKYKKTTTLSI